MLYSQKGIKMTEKLIAGLEKLKLQLSLRQTEQLEAYINEVLEFNKGYNLMKADSADEMAVSHILDSLAAYEPVKGLIEKRCADKGTDVLEIADIGSGGGCPGVPLDIVFCCFFVTRTYNASILGKWLFKLYICCVAFNYIHYSMG